MVLAIVSVSPSLKNNCIIPSFVECMEVASALGKPTQFEALERLESATYFSMLDATIVQ